MAAIEFTLNGRPQRIQGLPPDTTLLRFLRDQLLETGTKEGCAEGDCGACTVAMLQPDALGGPAWRSINSCLLPLASLHGREVVTVEGLAEQDALHPAQEAMVEALGSQCGYCTPGFVMSLFTACYRRDLDADWKREDQLCGNLCRCTGYRPIREAMRAVGGSQPEDRFQEALTGPHAPLEPLEYQSEEGSFHRPETLEALWALREAQPSANLVQGATDLGLAITKRRERDPDWISLEGIPELRQLTRLEGGWSLGAGLRLSDLERWAEDELPMLARMLRYFGARAIKNRGTLGGNLCTASPIGDCAPVLLALDAELILAGPGGRRRIPVAEFFKAYRVTALAEDEILLSVELKDPEEGVLRSAYKVCKRQELDISTVSGAFSVVLAAGRVQRCRLAFGGMAATPARARAAEAALLGAPWTEEGVQPALRALREEFSPLSDHRGSAWYRSQVAGNLLLGFLTETQSESRPAFVNRPSGAVLGSPS